MSDTDTAFARLRAGGLLADDRDLVCLFEGDPNAPDFVERARASRPHFFHRSVRDLSASAYAEAETAMLRDVRRGIHAKSHAASIARLSALFERAPK